MEYLFLVKKVLTPLFYPLTVVVVLLIVTLFLLMRRKPSRAARWTLVAALLILIVASYGFFARGPIGYLEGQYPAVADPSPYIGKVRYIVVLGGGADDDPSLPPGSRLSREALGRLFEGIRLHRSLPGSRLIVSGGAYFDEAKEGDIMAQTALHMGVQNQDLIRETRSLDTEDQARLLKPILGGEPFFLVTSALHMPRSVLAFRMVGLNPVPAPADHVIKLKKRYHPRDYFPDPYYLLNAERAVHESLGILWLKVKGLFPR